MTCVSQVDSINRFAANYQEKPILSFGGIHPACENYKEILRQVKELGMKGIKLHPDYQDMYFNDIRYKRLISFASELGLIISVHAGVDPKCPQDVHCTPGVVLDHISQEQFLRIVRNHGVDRILFATDSPWKGQKEFVKTLSDMPLDPSEKELIFSGNACRLLEI